MTVSFGKPKQAFVGKSKLTKALQAGFKIQCAEPDVERLWQVADEVCRNYPTRRALLGTRGAMIFFPRGNKERSVGYGIVSGSGQISPDWTLRIDGNSPNYFLRVVQAKLVSGKVEQASELETFVNTFETALRGIDSSASVTLCQPI